MAAQIMQKIKPELSVAFLGLCFLFLCWSCLSLSACSSPGTYMGPLDVKRPFRLNGRQMYPQFRAITPDLIASDCVNNTNHEYQVGSQDILTIIVWNHPELTIPSMQTTSENVNIYTSLNQSSNNPPGILVNEHGSIFFPLAGNINVAHSTVAQIREIITQRLRKYIRNPQVSVRVSAFRNKPVYILGEVMKSGPQYITDMPLTILDALNQAGGIDRDNSDPHFIYIIRGDYRAPCVYWLDASTPSALLIAAHFKLQSHDVLMVSTAGVARYARTINRILPTIQTITNQPIRTKD